MRSKTLLELSQLQDSKGLDILVTLGCSWTRGIGTGYSNDMSEDEYHAIKDRSDINDIYSFRGIISDNLNVYNLNLSQGGSSNQRQFRYASELFTNNTFNKIAKNNNILVLWAITSTARNELWSNATNEYNNFKYDIDITKLSMMLLNEVYNHESVIKELSEQMYIWNGFFKSMGIKNLWTDTFNTHKYTTNIKNLVDNGDLMTQIANNVQSTGYHYSSWVNDDNRIKELIRTNMLNPFTYHPTKLGHRKIAEILTPYVRDLL